tara:strand:+ start:460 stop:759 length:300 start_codon:yes stop_codon:yes gene_type:complete
MNIDYNCDIIKVNYVLVEDQLYYVIKNIEYNYIGTEKTTQTKFEIPGNVDLLKPNPKSFITKEDVKKQDYIDWMVAAGLSFDYLNEIIKYEIYRIVANN